MGIRPGRRRKARQLVNCDLELRPLMNVFIVLIPMLLMSAVFIEIRVIEMSLPDAQAAEAPPEQEPIDLAVHIESSTYSLEVNGNVIQTVARVEEGPKHLMPGPDASAQLAQGFAAMATSHPGHPQVRIVAQAGTRYREIVALMDLSRAAGLTQAGLQSSSEGGQ
jgi:biopolymer transport protein ExbD